MTSQRNPRGSVTAPLPVAWDADRTARAAAPDRGARCTTHGCIVRYTSGPDRPCREHADQDEHDEHDPRLRALARAAPARDHNWPKPRDLTPDERAGLGREEAGQ